MAYVICHFCREKFHENDEHTCSKEGLKQTIEKLRDDLQDCQNRLRDERDPQLGW